MLMNFVQSEKPAVLKACTAGVVRTTEQLGELKSEWQALFDESPSASAPLRFEWVWRWWNIFGPIYGNEGNGLRIVTFRRGEMLVGILPLYENPSGPMPLTVNRLRFISTGAAEFEETCAEYLNLLYAQGEESACIDALVDLLLESADLKWDELLLQDMPEESPLMALRERLDGRGRRVKVESKGTCYIADMSGGMDAYMMGLSMTTRRKARKLLKQLPEPDFYFDVASCAEEAGDFFDELVQIHRKRWEGEGHSGSFSPRHLEFHRGIAMELAAGGEALVSRLKYRGQTIATAYGHRVGNRFEGYQVGVDHNAPGMRSAGAGLHLANMKYLLERGVVHYDHLAGFNQYKQDYAKMRRNLAGLTIAKPTIRAAIQDAVSYSRRAARKIASLIGNSGKRPAATTPAPAEPVGEAEDN